MNSLNVGLEEQDKSVIVSPETITNIFHLWLKDTFQGNKNIDAVFYNSGRLSGGSDFAGYLYKKLQSAAYAVRPKRNGFIIEGADARWSGVVSHELHLMACRRSATTWFESKLLHIWEEPFISKHESY